MNPEILDAIDEYYKLKSKYEKVKENEIKKYITDTDMSKKQKRELFSRFRPKCINCNRVGGSDFSNKKRVLKAVCKASPPCKLDIEIQLGEYNTKYNALDSYKNYRDEDQLNIIKTKLNLLFNFATEQETIAKFEELKENFLDMNKIYNSLLSDYLQIVENPTRQMNLNDGIVSLYENVEELKKIFKDYSTDSKPEYIRDMVELFINKIQPNAERNRNLTYSYNSVDQEDDVMILVQKPYTIDQIEINIGEKERIIKNTH
jgi:hypothetical protein